MTNYSRNVKTHFNDTSCSIANRIKMLFKHFNFQNFFFSSLPQARRFVREQSLKAPREPSRKQKKTITLLRSSYISYNIEIVYLSRSTTSRSIPLRSVLLYRTIIFNLISISPGEVFPQSYTSRSTTLQ